jgi:adenosylcobinamide kinase/adenosylcobinamide-phosphate guanylyltransferase
MARLVLVTGGARSGKSRFAEARLKELAPDGPWLYVATAESRDDEMAVRIAGHRERRGEAFRTVEAPQDPAAALADPGVRGALVDCVTLFVSNRLLAGADDRVILDESERLADAAQRAPGPVVVVTNEVGLGIVPENPLARRFRDLAGLANQRLAARADEVVLVVCGLPLRLR